MIQLAFALLPVALRYGVFAGLIYLAGHYWGWANMNQLGAIITGTIQGIAIDVGLPVDEITTWLSWVLAGFPESWPTWAKILFLMGLVAAVRNHSVRWALRDLSRPATRTLKWILLAPYRLIRRLLLIRFAPFGQSRWAKVRDLKKEGMLKPGGLFLGQFRTRLGHLFRRYDLHHHGEGHFITIALPGVARPPQRSYRRF